MEKQNKHISDWMMEAIKSYKERIGLDKSVKTVEAYVSDIMNLLTYLHSKGMKRVSSLKGDTIISYLAYQKSLGRSDASLHRYYIAIKSFCHYLRITRAISDDICLDVKAPRFKREAPYVPSKEEIERVLEQPNLSTLIGVRDKAILELLYSSGLRASELCNLDIKDCGDMQVTIRAGKGGKNRTIPITQQAYETIANYILRRGTEPGYLFKTLYGKRVLRQTLTKLVSQYGKKAGIPEISAHTIRHACATHLLEQGAELVLIQKILGHSSVATTQIYTQLSSNTMQEMFKQYHPRKSCEPLQSRN